MTEKWGDRYVSEEAGAVLDVLHDIRRTLDELLIEAKKANRPFVLRLDPEPEPDTTGDAA